MSKDTSTHVTDGKINYDFSNRSKSAGSYFNNLYIFSENYTDSNTLNDTGDDKNDPAQKNKVTRHIKKASVKSTTKGKSLTPSQMLAKEKGKTLRWNREPYKRDTSAEGL